MAKRSSRQNFAIIQAAFPECQITRGWILSGAGPARFGWAARHPGGAVRFLGRSSHDAVQMILREIDKQAVIS